MLKNKNTKYFCEKCTGFTLVELLVALVVSGIIMTGVYSAFKTQQDSFTAQDQVVEMQQNIRSAFYLLADELRMAGYDMDKNGSKTDTAGITAASPTSITFTIVADTDGVDNAAPSGADEVGELKTITYDLYDAYSNGINDIGRQVGSVKSAVAENIEQLEFLYTLADGTQVLAPTTAQLPLIRSIQVSMLAITAHPDRKYTNNQSYAPASASAIASGIDWSPSSPDHFRRRFQTMTIKLRNMGL